MGPNFYFRRLSVRGSMPPMKVNLGIWDQLNRLILALLVVAAVVGVILWYLPTIQENERRRRDIMRHEALVQQELRRLQENRAQLKAFDDPRAVERMAREQLNLARTGEWVIRFEEPVSNRPAAAPR